jgi:hypothetical protein
VRGRIFYFTNFESDPFLLEGDEGVQPLDELEARSSSTVPLQSTGGPMLEHGGMPSAGAVASLARWSGLTFDEVRAYLSAGNLNELIVEVRSARGEPVATTQCSPRSSGCIGSGNSGPASLAPSSSSGARLAGCSASVVPAEADADIHALRLERRCIRDVASAVGSTGSWRSSTCTGARCCRCSPIALRGASSRYVRWAACCARSNRNSLHVRRSRRWLSRRA